MVQSMQRLCVDRLSPCLWLTLQPYDIQSTCMTNLTRVFKSLKLAIASLETYYDSIATKTDVTDQTVVCSYRFPCHVKCGQETLHYEKRLTRQLSLSCQVM